MASLKLLINTPHHSRCQSGVPCRSFWNVFFVLPYGAICVLYTLTVQFFGLGPALLDIYGRL